MRRIAIISEHASPLAQAGSVDSGGQNIYVAQLARQFARRGLEVDVYTRRDNIFLPGIVQWMPNVRVIHLSAGPARYLPKEDLLAHMGAFSLQLARHVSDRASGYDVMHANFFMSAMASLPVAQSHGIPLAVTFHALGRVRRLHQQEADRFPDSRFNIEDDIVRRADRIIAECPEDRKDLVELYGADVRRINIVPCGYDADEMSPMDMAAARDALGWDRDQFRILQLGRIVPRKGIDNVIRALALLHGRYGLRDARLCVVGGNDVDATAQATPEIGRLRALAEEQGVLDRVEFTGRRDRAQLAAYYGASDVFVTTPWYEPFGITPVEAMACERPVIGSDTGGIRNTVVHGQTGFLVPARDPGSLAQRLAELAGDAGLRRRMGRKGRDRAHRYYTWDRVAQELLDIYAGMAAAQRQELRPLAQVVA